MGLGKLELQLLDLVLIFLRLILAGCITIPMLSLNLGRQQAVLVSGFQIFHFLCIIRLGQQHSEKKHVRLQNLNLTYSQAEVESAAVFSLAHVSRLLGEGDELVFTNMGSARIKGTRLKMLCCKFKNVRRSSESSNEWLHPKLADWVSKLYSVQAELQ